MIPKVSIIIPVYNCEATIEKCIDSVLNQIIKEFELILVNDGSSDSCGKICDYYANKDKRIKVIHKNNEGCSAARNDGIGISKGEYIGFVDADDYIEPNMYSEMYDLARKFDLDVVEVGFRRLFNDEYKLLFPVTDVSAPNVTNKIIRKQLIDKYNILFPTSSHMGEDLAFSTKVDLVSANRRIIRIAPYNYILSDDSVSHKVYKRFDIFDSIDDILKFEKTLSVKNNVNLSKIIYRHGFDLPLFNITSSPDRKKYLKLLISKILLYKSHLSFRHKLLIFRHCLASYIKFNHQNIYNAFSGVKGMLRMVIMR